jgi:regulator of ribonuclease activity A
VNVVFALLFHPEVEREALGSTPFRWLARKLHSGLFLAVHVIPLEESVEFSTSLVGRRKSAPETFGETDLYIPHESVHTGYCIPGGRTMQTSDLCDAHSDVLEVVEPLFQNYGGARAFFGPCSTVRVQEDNVLVRTALEEPGAGRVLVVDGGGSLRCALLGDQLATLAHKNGWAGIVVHGCIRDSRAISKIPIGVKALNTNPLKSTKRGNGERDVRVTIGNATFQPGHFVYGDEDGLLVSPRALTLP